ncbi:MAG: sulfotransferase family 2 domain-containing protein [Gallionellaceae bacterium]
MFYNREKQFLFIHVQRTGGSSLISHFYNMMNNDGSNYFHHTSLSYFQRKEAEAYNSSFRFTFVRNPWDRFASWYALLKNGSMAERFGSFEEELLKVTVHAHNTPKLSRFPISQLELLKDNEGKVSMNFIGRYENYQQDVTHVLKHLDIPHEGVEHLNGAKQKHYSSFYTSSTRDIVAELLAPSSNVRYAPSRNVRC